MPSRELQFLRRPREEERRGNPSTPGSRRVPGRFASEQIVPVVRFPPPSARRYYAVTSGLFMAQMRPIHATDVGRSL